MTKCEGCVYYGFVDKCKECDDWSKYKCVMCYDVGCNSNCSEYLHCERSAYVMRLEMQRKKYEAIKWDNHGCLAMDNDEIDCVGHCNDCIYLCEIDDNGAVILYPDKEEEDEYCAPEGGVVYGLPPAETAYWLSHIRGK